MFLNPPFRLWLRLCSIMPLWFVGIIALFFLENYPWAAVALWVMTILLFAFCLYGAFLGIFLSLGKLSFRCPYCPKVCPCVSFEQKKILIECEDCGVIEGAFSQFPPFSYSVEKLDMEEIEQD